MNKEWQQQAAKANTFMIPREWVGHCKTKSVQYIMDIDTLDDDVWAYCLAMDRGDHMEIILQKSMRDKREFKEEVENLAKYFDISIKEWE